MYTYYSVVRFCEQFRVLKGLQKLTLDCHCHTSGYPSKGSYYDDDFEYLKIDLRELTARATELKFPFEIAFTDVDISEISDIGSEKGGQEGSEDGSEEDNEVGSEGGGSES
jgi:hypothetical protein